jgi:hypothetical protein
MALREEPTRWDAASLSPQPSRRKGGKPSSPFDDEQVFDRFVDSLRSKIAKQLDCCLDGHVQLELARLMRLLIVMPRASVYESRALFEMAFEQLGAEHPNLVLAARLRADLGVSNIRSTRLGRLIAGKMAIQTVVLGLLSTFLLLLAGMASLDLGQAYLRRVEQSTLLSHPIADLIQRMPVAQLTSLVVAAFVGAVVSVLARLRSMLELARVAPLLVYVTVATKPFVSVAFATFIYAVIGSGLISIPGISLDSPQAGYLVWTIGFLSGFSERFVQDFVGQADRIVAPEAVAQDSPRAGPSP